MPGSEEERITIEEAIAAVRPAIQSDGGDLELVSIEKDIVRVHLGGNCAGCHMAGQTLGGIRRHLTEALGRPVRVFPAWKDEGKD